MGWLGERATGDVGWDAVSEGDIETAWAQRLRFDEANEAADAALLTGAYEVSLDGARRIACTHHLLQRAMERMLAHSRPAATAGKGAEVSMHQARAAASTRGEGVGQRAGRKGDAEQPGGTATARGGGHLSRLAAAMVRDAAQGRSLLNSDALATAEVARQLRLPLSAVAVIRAPTNSGSDTTSWYTGAHTRLRHLMQRLVRAKVALRSRVTSEEGSASALAAGDEVASARSWATRAAGVRLSQPTPLQSVYDLAAPPTHVVPRYANTLDWIFVEPQRLEVLAVAPRPPLEELTRDVAMPSAEWPSDHVSLVADVGFNTYG